MTYEQVKNLKPEEFKRLCGVRQETFSHMVEVVKTYSPAKQKTGRPGKLGLEDQLLMTLEYLREYRTYFHIGQSWGVNESTAYRIIRRIEDTLIDLTETPIERQKKNKSDSSVEKRKTTHLSHRSS
jgi:hypothetical protein